jgi:phosphoglycerate dehydrogenase-like enzyme
VPELHDRIRRGEKCLAIDHLGRTLFGKEVGVVGMGSTARKAAELFHVSGALLYQRRVGLSAWSRRLGLGAWGLGLVILGMSLES